MQLPCHFSGKEKSVSSVFHRFFRPKHSHDFTLQARFYTFITKNKTQSQPNDFSSGWKNIFFLRRNPDFSPHEAGRLGAKRDKNVLKTPIFLLIDGFQVTKVVCHFVSRTCRRLTHGSTPCGRNLPGPYRLQVCGSKRDAMCFASGAWESLRFRRAGFGVEIRESRVRLCGDKEMVTWKFI